MPDSTPDGGTSDGGVAILIVDDNEAKLLAMETALAPLGEEVVRASSGSEALRHLLERDFATVVLDVHMPGLDGFATAQMIRSRTRSEGTPIIFISAVNIEEADALRGYSLGAVDYICAPIIPEVLRAKVAVFVELYRKTREARARAHELERQAVKLEQSQRELRLSERMASIGTLCAGLGHDMGNLLLPVSVWLDALEAETDDPALRGHLDGVRGCVQYLRKLASGLRLMALDPGKPADPSRIELAPWVHEMGAILRNALPRGVVLEYDVDPALPPVRMAQHHLAQALFNLVQNAGEALRGREQGRVRIWARMGSERDTVLIGVSDNGPGMTPEVLARCLDPFFTTKTRGISTGLGLSLVHGIVSSTGSHLDIESTPATGSTFSFALHTWKSEPRCETAAVITVTDQRLRSLAATTARSAGFRLVPDLDALERRPAVWISDPHDDLDERSRAFLSGGDHRHVIVLTRGREASADRAAHGASVAACTGPGGLASRLREVLDRVPAPRGDDVTDPCERSLT